jgi:hypothetical protein
MKDPDLLFACRLGKDLGLTLEQIYDMSVVEFQTWAAFYSIEQKEAKKQSQRR